MSNNKFNNTNFRGQSIADPGNVLKNAHNPTKNSIDVSDSNSIIKVAYDRLEVTYNTNADPTLITYYKDTFEEITQIICSGDISGSLNNKYFFIYTGRDETKYHVWYNVNSAGIDPAPGGSTAIQINLNTNDVKEVVALATKLAIDTKTDFNATYNKEIVTVTCVEKGATTASLDGNTGFSISQLQAGSEDLIDTIILTYSTSGNPIYKNQEYKGYKYNIYTSMFEFNSLVNTYDPDLRAIRITKATRNNTVQSVKTTINSTTPVKINLPGNASVMKLIYNSTETLWIGPNVTITPETSGAFPVLTDEYFEITLIKGNSNNFYGISSSGNIDVYVYGEIEV